MSADCVIAVYRFTGHLIAPLLPLLLRHRERKGKEDCVRGNERLGFGRGQRPRGPLVWVHAASIGEMNASGDLMNALAGKGFTVLLSTGTVTSAELAPGLLPPGGVHVYSPLDAAPFVDRYLDHWQPDLVLFVESEMWPAMLSSLRRRQIPIALVNGRISERSAAGWQRVPWLARNLFGTFDVVLASSEADAQRLRDLGGRNVTMTGNLKYDRVVPPADEAVLSELAKRIGARQVLAGASTHSGEEEQLLACLDMVSTATPRPLLLIVPRHPRRGEDIADLARQAGRSVARRSLGEELTAHTDVYIADTLGELTTLLRLVPFAFVGGTLVPRGGQSPIEAAKLGVFVLHGPETANFRATYKALDDLGAAAQVTGQDDLQAQVQWCLDNPVAAKAAGAKGRAHIEQSRGALAATLTALEPFLLPRS